MNDVMQCPHCQQLLDTKAILSGQCQSCGRQFTNCQRCGAPLEQANIACSACGYELQDATILGRAHPESDRHYWQHQNEIARQVREVESQASETRMSAMLAEEEERLKILHQRERAYRIKEKRLMALAYGAIALVILIIVLVAVFG